MLEIPVDCERLRKDIYEEQLQRIVLNVNKDLLNLFFFFFLKEITWFQAQNVLALCFKCIKTSLSCLIKKYFTWIMIVILFMFNVFFLS